MYLLRLRLSGRHQGWGIRTGAYFLIPYKEAFKADFPSDWTIFLSFKADPFSQVWNLIFYNGWGSGAKSRFCGLKSWAKTNTYYEGRAGIILFILYRFEVLVCVLEIPMIIDDCPLSILVKFSVNPSESFRKVRNSWCI